MSKSEGNRELLERMHYLESQLSNALEKIERTSSNELNDLRDLVKESIDANKMNIQNNDKKLSILFERVERHINEYQEQKNMQWSVNKNFEEMVSVLREKNKVLEKENIFQKEKDDFQKEKFISMISEYKTENKDLYGRELEKRYEILNKYLGKSIGNKVEWTSFINNADLEVISEIVLIYLTFSLPYNSNINYHQLKRRLEDLSQLSKKDIEKELIDEMITSLSRSYFRKNKVKSRENFLSDAAQKELNKTTKDALIKDVMSKSPMRVFSIRLNQNYLDRLNKIAKITGNNRNELIRDAVEKALDRWEDLDENDLVN